MKDGRVVDLGLCTRVGPGRVGRSSCFSKGDEGFSSGSGVYSLSVKNYVME